jgi:serine/threonine protein kinase
MDDIQPVIVGGRNYVLRIARGVLVRTSEDNMPTMGGQETAGRATVWSDSDDSDNVDEGDQVNGGNSNCKMKEEKKVYEPNGNTTSGVAERAYWVRQVLCAAIYGNVSYGIVLQKLYPPIQVMHPRTQQFVTVEWEETSTAAAIKVMLWKHIRLNKNKLSEDPIKEVATLRYLKNRYENTAGLGLHAYDVGDMMYNSAMPDAPPGSMVMYQNSQYRLEPHVSMELDLFSDEQFLYSMTPYCAGGELFDVLERKRRFCEPEARFWMRQLLHGVKYLKDAGITHRDLSLENLLVHQGKIQIIDMGMSLRIPIDEVTGRRFLIHPQGVCGKWQYMSPEVCMNITPFDGPAIDLWAAGVILFLMLTGFPPWERAVLDDERFRYMSNGYLVQMLTDWKVGLSPDAMDLLQRMVMFDPSDRLCVEQVLAHPWLSQSLPEYCIMETDYPFPRPTQSLMALFQGVNNSEVGE